MIYFILQKKNLGDFDSDLSVSQSELEIIDLISKEVNTSTLMIFWQFTLKGLEELSIAANSILSLEMLIMRLIHLKDMPSYEEIFNSLNDKDNTNPSNENINIKSRLIKDDIINQNEGTKKISKNQIKNTQQTKPLLSTSESESLKKNFNLETISSFEDLIKLSSLKKEVELKYDLERNVNLVKFSENKIDITFNENLKKDFVRNLSEKLLEWTGKRWLITLTKEAGQKTFSELQIMKEKQILEEEKKGKIYKKFKDIFSDAELVKVLKKD